MKLFPYAHATHPSWRMAVELVLAQLHSFQKNPDYAANPNLGVLYITDHYAGVAQEILEALKEALPSVSHWTGTVGVGISSNNVEYFDEPALSTMLCDVEPINFRVFNGVSPLSAALKSDFSAKVALIHADGQTPDLGELITELAQNTQQNYLFGGLSSSRSEVVQFSSSSNLNSSATDSNFEHEKQLRSKGVFTGGLSGVAFDSSVKIITRVTQGCYPISKSRKITACDQHVVLMLDDRPALDVLLEDLEISIQSPRENLLRKVRDTLVGLTQQSVESTKKTGGLQDDVLVRHIIGLDTQRSGVAIAEMLKVGMQLTFCERNTSAAKADLIRICTEIREALEPEEMSELQAQQLNSASLLNAPLAGRKIAGAIYVSCAGRGGPHFGSPSAELQILNRALGDIPLTGFFAGGEIAYQNLYGYTGVLTVFAIDKVKANPNLD